MGTKTRWLRHLGAFAVALCGCAGVLALMLVMNLRDKGNKRGSAAKKLSFVYQPPRRKPPVRRKVRKPRRQLQPVSRPPLAPLPQLASSLSGVDFGIPTLAATGLENASNQLLGRGQKLGQLVMTERSVDRPPQVAHRVVPQYPARARSQGITGQVTLQILIGTQGEVQEVQIASSQPRGVFDQVAIAAIRQWRFQPAMYKGQPVKVRATQTLRFQLN